MNRAEAKRRTLRQSIKDSWSIHVEKPQILVVSTAAAILLFIMGRATGTKDPATGDLARLLAFTPADRFTDISLAEGGWTRFLLLPGFLVRAAVIATVVSLSIGAAISVQRMAKLALVYIAATASITVPFILGIAYLGQRAQAQAGSGGGLGLLILAVFPIVLLLLTVLFTPMVLQAASGWRLRPLLTDYRIWSLSAGSLWLWASTSKRIDQLGDGAVGFLLALMILAIQSVLLVAALVVTSDQSRVAMGDDQPKEKVLSSVGAASSA